MAQIVWTEPAIRDLQTIAGYIALDKPHAAKQLVQKVVGRVEHLGLFSKTGGKPRDLLGTPYRRIVVPPLKIFYRTDGNVVFIIYVMRSERRFSLDDISDRDR